MFTFIQFLQLINTPIFYRFHADAKNSDKTIRRYFYKEPSLVLKVPVFGPLFIPFQH